MQNEQQFNNIIHCLQLARQRHKIDPSDTMETQTYINHVEHLLIELENTITLNRLQARHIQAYAEQHPPQVSKFDKCYGF